MNSESVILNLNDNTLWAPYKGLFNLIHTAVTQNDNAIQDLELTLRRHKPDFLCLLRNPPRSSIHREAIKQASITGIAVIGRPGLQVLPQSLIDEALIISDMFELNEITSLELLIAGQQQQPRFPSLTRGLVAMLLYYDGRRNLVNALQLLVQAREGRTWTLGVGSELLATITRFTDQLKEDGIIIKVISLIEKLDVVKELELLQRNRALGGPRYRKQVTDLISEIKQTLAEIVFGWACQDTFTQDEVVCMLNFLSTQAKASGDGSLDETTLTVVMAMLYVMDVSILQTTDETDARIQKLNLVCVPELSAVIHKQLITLKEKWQIPGLKAIFQLAWGITLRTLSQFPVQSIGGHMGEFLEEDEKAVEMAMEESAFTALKNLIIKNSVFHNQEFFLKRIHNVITDFIVLMSSKVKELKNSGDETARIIASHQQEGLEPPTHLPLHFEHLMNAITDLYSKDPIHLQLALEFWSPSENVFDQSYVQRSSPRQVALNNFVQKTACESLPSALFIPYHHMLTSLSNSPQCAHFCFSMLKINSENAASSCSWKIFFSALHKYYNGLHEVLPPSLDRQYARPQRMHQKGITPQEVQFLIAVLQLIARIVQMDEIARIALAENTEYLPAVVILGLVTCSIPAHLKAALLNCLAAFAKSPELALNIWHGLEMAQIIPSNKSVAFYHPSGILMELEEVETRMEEYPVTRAMLGLLDALLNHPHPFNLGANTRQPGIEPYLQFVRDSVLLRCNSRAYKNDGEKWKIMALCLKVLEKVLRTSNFQSVAKTSPGISILSQMLQDSGLLRVVLFILDEGVKILDQYASVPNQCSLEECSLLALNLLHVTFTKQETFLQQIRDGGCDLLVTPLETLLMSINPRSGQADHLLVITKYVTYHAFLPKHSLYSISILNALCSSIPISQHLVSVYDSNMNESEIILKGFIEVLELDVSREDSEDDKVMQNRSKARQQLLQLLLKCLRHPGPNLSHYLLGFNLRKPINQTEIQEPGVMGSKRTCLHAILSFLDFGSHSGLCPSNVYNAARSCELAYQLIYVLCTNTHTSGPTLRYLRSTHDFLYRHLQFLPFRGTEVKNLRQQSWLLRALAVELRVTSAHHQRSHVQRLLSTLLDDILSGAGDMDPSFGVASVSSYSFMKPTTGTFRRKLMQILDSISFQHVLPASPHWDYFENEEVERILKQCEVQEANSPSLIDVQDLHSRLSEETLGLQSGSVLGQRPLMIQEISKVLEYAVSCNEARESVFAKRLLFDAWRQVAEVLLIACPLEMLGSEKKDQIVLEVSQELLAKIMEPDILIELMPPASGVILTLVSTLRHSMIASLVKPPFSPFDSEHSRIPHQSSLLAVLRAVVDCLLRTGTGFQRVRANFYSAFLNLLCIVQKPYDIASEPVGVGSMILDQETEAKKLRTQYMDIILSFGDTIMEIICRDACTGHDITKMLSLAVLDVAVSLDSQQQWLAFLVSKGYLRHILDSLSKDDEELQNLFNKNSNSYRIYYVFESKMALLTRISCSSNGAFALLRNGAIHKLAECRALDLRPDISNEMRQDNSNWIWPDLLKCYRQVFMAIMKLIISIPMTLGSGHREATLQLLEFVACNGELFSHVIRDPNNLYTVEALEELNVISAVLSKATLDDISSFSSDTFLSEQRGHLVLLRQHMLMLLPRLMAIENIEASDPQTIAKIKMYRLQIASHVLRSCCTKSSHDMQNSAIFFSPHIAEPSSTDSFNLSSSSKRSISRSPDLGLLMTLLYRSASEIQISTDEQKVLMQRLQSLQTLTSDELAEYLPASLKEDHSTIQYQREFVRNMLQKLVKYKSKEISTLAYMIETSAFILLRHLEYFFVTCKKENIPFGFPDKTQHHIRRLQDGNIARPLSAQNSVRTENRSQLMASQMDDFKTDIKTTLGDAFFRKLKSVEQIVNQERSHTSFLETIGNRLKRLVKIQIR